MNQDHNPRRVLTGKGFFVTLTICLVAVGVLGWFALFGRGNKADSSEPEHQVPEVQQEDTSSSRQDTAAGPGLPDDADAADDSRADAPDTAANADAPMEVQSINDVQAEEPVVMPEASVPAEPVQTLSDAPITVEAPSLVVQPLSGEVAAVFSVDALQYNETMGDWRTHAGVDIAADQGTAVLAASQGTVSAVEDDPLMGTTVTIAHDDGYETIYANLQAKPTVSTGDTVTVGQVLGAVGSTSALEAAEGPHLHFAVTKDGAAVDPDEFLNR